MNTLLKPSIAKITFAVSAIFFVATSQARTISKNLIPDPYSNLATVRLVMEARPLAFFETLYCGQHASTPGNCAVYRYDGQFMENIRLEGTLKNGKSFAQQGMYTLVSNLSSRLFEGTDSEELGKDLCAIAGKNLQKSLHHNFGLRNPIVWNSTKGIVEIIYTNAKKASDDTLIAGIGYNDMNTGPLKPAASRASGDEVTGKNSVFCAYSKDPVQVNLPEEAIQKYRLGQ